jgi:uncharacterized membrane protein YfcA
MVLGAAAGFLSGIIASMGLGGGAVLLLYLTLIANVPQQQAQGINLLFFLPCAMVALVIHGIKKQIEWKKAAVMALGGLPGAVCGWLLSGVFAPDILQKIFAVFLLFIGLKELFCSGSEKPIGQKL